jgi:tRNA 2-thiouridine synthesizing protein A
MTHTVLDTSGMICPIPVLKAKKAITPLNPGDVLEIIATDPGAVLDFDVFCTIGGHTIIHQSEKNGVYRFKIERGTRPHT